MTPSAKPKESTDQFVEMITLQDRPVLLRHERLDLSAVHLDPANQRVQFLLSGRAAEAGEQEIADLVWERPATKALSRAIKATGGLIESIIVKGDTVVEGNCRLVCYRKLREQDPENPRWETIPARLLPDDITDQQIAMLLGDFHVAGKNEWTLFEQAAYVYRMHHEMAYSQEFLAEHLRRSKSYINQLFHAYEIMKDRYLAAYPGPESVEKFSYFLEFAKKFRQPGENDIENLVRWVGENRLTEGRQVRRLPDILSTPKAQEALDNVGYEAAQEVLEAEHPELVSPLFATMGRMISALRTAPLEELQALRDGDEAKVHQVAELCQALSDFLKMAELELRLGVAVAAHTTED